VNEGIQSTIVRLDEAKALCGIEPFNCSGVHEKPFRENMNDDTLTRGAK